MTRNDLVRFRSMFAECELILLADVSAGTVLASDSSVPQGQERLDVLGDLAGALFRRGSPATGCAILCAPTGSRMFLQSPTDPAEVLCLLLGPRADLPTIEAAASELLAATVLS